MRVRSSSSELAKAYDFGMSYNLDGGIQSVGLPAAGDLPAESNPLTWRGTRSALLILTALNRLRTSRPCWRAARRSPPGSVISDSSDNPTAGGTGDVL